MIQTIHGRNVPEVYIEGLWKLHVCGIVEDSRNGPVIVMPAPTILEITNPWERVLFDPIRDANPFFHVMEFVWMMAGSNDAVWISQFNKRMMEYADDGTLRGAYGFRWQDPTDQITTLIAHLKKLPETRQAVLSMWDPSYDGPDARTSDRPCNTHIYFRHSRRGLDMTVCNRSNDFFWGMLGSNVVHFTLLHELVSRAVGVKQGIYRVFTNNLHVYPDMSRFKEIYNHRIEQNAYKDHYSNITFPLLQEGEDWRDLVADCHVIVYGHYKDSHKILTHWVRNVAWPIHQAYLDRPNRDDWISKIAATDWRIACQEWNSRRK